MEIHPGRRAAPRLLEAYLRHVEDSAQHVPPAERLVVVLHGDAILDRLRERAGTTEITLPIPRSTQPTRLGRARHA